MGSTRNLTVACLLICLSFASTIQAESDCETPPPLSIEEIIPPVLVIPAGNELDRLLLGVGSQIYTYNGTAWVLTNVSADLFSFKGVKVGHHFFLTEVDANGGKATWETFHPASRVTGKAIVSVAQEDAIPWVLLQATNATGSPKFLGSTTYIQRLYTYHGLPPSNVSLPISPKAGDTFDSGYNAIYGFARKQG